MKLFLPVCDNGGGAVKGNYVLCLMKAFTGIDYVIARITDSHANRQCNKMANEFLKTDCDRMLIIDTDIIFTRTDIQNLLSHDVELVYGIYPKKDERGDPCLGTFGDVPLNGDLATLRRCGRGFMLVKRELIERMKEDNGGPALRYHNHGAVEWDFFPSGPVTGDFSALGDGVDADGYPLREWISEDWFFCERARQMGVPTVADVRIALRHEGGKVYELNPNDLRVVPIWQNIPGWFSEPDAECYRRIAAEIPEGGALAEIGVWQGRSLAALASFLGEKKIKIYAIDTFVGTPGLPTEQILQSTGINLKDVFEDNMRKAGLTDSLTVLQSTSLNASCQFTPKSLDAVFIDAAHDYDSVRRDIMTWLPAIKPGGIIAGHDYDGQYPGLMQAVNERFQNVETIGRCWFVKL
jgi:hypothetical protein